MLRRLDDVLHFIQGNCVFCLERCGECSKRAVDVFVLFLEISERVL